MLLIYAHDYSPRLQFIFEFIFTQVIGVKWSLTHDEAALLTHEGPVLAYSKDKLEGVPYIKSHTILFEEGVKEQELVVSQWGDYRVFFQTDKESVLPFDLFAASFYLMTRYEEYLDFEPDKYGRYPAEASIAYRKNFIQRPVVDLWAYMLRDQLKKRYPDLTFEKRTFAFLPTLDVDQAFAVRGKGFIRIAGSIVRDLFCLRFRDIYHKILVIKGTERDPFDSFDYIDEVHQTFSLKPIFFFLNGKNSKYDRHIPLKKKIMQELVKKIDKRFEVAVHSSFKSFNNQKEFERLKKELENTLKHPVTKSRQHYLKLAFPLTFKQLLNSGIKEDYSLGFASINGFRAGTCTPFYFFDLLKNEKSGLTMIPFQVMDATCKYYYKKGTEGVLEEIKRLIDEVKRVDGLFVSLWHNDSLRQENGKSAFCDLYIQMLDYINQKIEEVD